MKKRKVVSILTAAAMAFAAMPLSVMSASAAEGAYALGDVDMDGVLTGHDAAVLSRYLHVDSNAMTAEQLELADVNGDGTVDQEDLEWIHANQTSPLGVHDDVYGNVSSADAADQLIIAAYEGCGKLVIDNDAPALAGRDLLDDPRVTQVEYNRLDVNGSGDVNGKDVVDTLVMAACIGAGLPVDKCFEMGRYDYSADLLHKVLYQ